MPNWKKVVVSGSDARLASLFTTSHITGSGHISGSSTSTGSFGTVHTVGDLGIGTASPNVPLQVGSGTPGRSPTGGYFVGSVEFDSQIIGEGGLILFGGQLLNTGGSVGTPAYSFDGDTNTGMYRAGADTLAFTTGGTQAISIDSNQDISFSGNINTTGNGRVLEQGNSVIDHATAMAIVFGG
jgi:hypothetical protein|tara:strand:- start:553 stop:1101 length:549 start_codon:yes stop_codon:yes gene_type:complete